MIKRHSAFVTGGCKAALAAGKGRTACAVSAPASAAVAQPRSTISARAPSGEAFKAVQQRNLARQNLLSGERKIEPASAVDFGNLHHATAAPRPFDRDHIAAHRVHIEIALQCEGADKFSGTLTYLAERKERTVRLGAKLFLEFAPRRDFRILARVEFPFGDGPGSEISIAPEKSTGMNEKDVQAIAAVAVHQDACAHDRHRRQSMISQSREILLRGNIA